MAAFAEGPGFNIFFLTDGTLKTPASNVFARYHPKIGI